MLAMDAPQNETRGNGTTALVLLSVALAFFLGVIVNRILFG